jgi:hypothetical protein
MWSAFAFLIGSWQGNGSGQPGNSQVERSYQIILNGNFLEVKNKSTYPPQSRNPQEEIHEDLGLFSYDKARKTYVLRQFQVEGFVNGYSRDLFAAYPQMEATGDGH